MNFPERMTKIRSKSRVLQVGPEGSPHSRADVLLDKVSTREEEAAAQSGYANKSDAKQKKVFYSGGRFPFKDKEFDYVICSHVLQQVPAEELSTFVSELQRVANAGFVEYPTVFYELINYQHVHLWLMNFRDDTVLFLDKRTFKSNYVHKVFREMFYGSDQYMIESFHRYRELFFNAFEWEGTINYRLVASYDDLINAYDFNKYKSYFSHFDKSNRQYSLVRVRAKRIISRAVNSLRHAYKMRYGHFVHPTAQLDNKKLIRIMRRAEIQDYVIIRTYTHPVRIGEYTQINPFTVIYGGSGVFIGNNVMIAPHCMLAAGNHDYKQIDKPIRHAGNLSQGPIIIEDNVWIGAHVTITDGVTIGRDAVVAANSVVTRDVAPYDIVGGVPARVIGNRKTLAQKTASVL